MADLICDRYLGAQQPRLVDTPDTDKNLAPIHALCLLYQETGGERYLQMALQILDEFAAVGPNGPLAGNYLRGALAGKAFYQLPKPRWESLHAVMGLAQLYWILGRDDCRRAFESLWWSMLEGDRHNNGGFTSGEKATGNPYHLGPIETCCTVAWIALSVEMLKLTGSSIVADELELSTLNSVLGMHSPTGRWATYNTPMNGIRRASAHSIVFQAREGSPELNCCSVNSPRGLGLLSAWAFMRDVEGLIVNGYGSFSLEGVPCGLATLSLTQETDYPTSGRVHLNVGVSEPVRTCLKLRIPYWSDGTAVRVNGASVDGVQAGSYLALDRVWRSGDQIELDLNVALHVWPGERECAGRAALYHGPLLLAFDHRYNLALSAGEPLAVRELDEWKVTASALPYTPRLDLERLGLAPVSWEDWLPPEILLEGRAADGSVVRLCDFASAGVAGTPYQTWLEVDEAPERVDFSCRRPLRSVRVQGE
jgi:DUF1680 family protein